MSILLQLQGIRCQFGGVTAVNNLDLAVVPQQIFGLIGPNGAGKTTVFNTVTGLITPGEGAVFFDGRRIDRLQPDAIARLGVARTFQNIRLFGNLSVRENVLVGMHGGLQAGLWAGVLGLARAEEARARQRADDLLQMTGLAGMAQRQGTGLSYGDQRRLEIARALALSPRLLLLDEPAAGMNETESTALMDLIRRIRQDLGVTVLLIEHDMHFVMNLCDTVAVLNFGQKIAEGTPPQVQKHPAVITAYLGED